MIHGLDTGFLVASELSEHADYLDAKATLSRLLGSGDQVGVAPQVLAEFIHIATDVRRFSKPVSMIAACESAEVWWAADDVTSFPNDDATRQFLAWMNEHSLGRKRLLDTLLAATYRQAGIQSLLTTNPADLPSLASSRASRRRAV